MTLNYPDEYKNKLFAFYNVICNLSLCSECEEYKRKSQLETREELAKERNLFQSCTQIMTCYLLKSHCSTYTHKELRFGQYFQNFEFKIWESEYQKSSVFEFLNECFYTLHNILFYRSRISLDPLFGHYVSNISNINLRPC